MLSSQKRAPLLHCTPWKTFSALKQRANHQVGEETTFFFLSAKIEPVIGELLPSGPQSKDTGASEISSPYKDLLLFNQ
ncbi:hypothetical protein AMELA_G00201710 [Ameiurus melas]|uniref:Uncharacterized protein n=1 Tax=Ameiurus melas TaxID=219545 RepID=A0A7J6A791_AMEME|nr:hypothetical protein AMELA_G00201710 [Ameiurus melas]